MKKLLAFVLASGMAIPCVSAMAERIYVEGVYENNALTVTYNEAEGDVATVALYDGGKLCGIKTAKVNDGKYTFNITESDKDKEMRIFYYGEKSYPVEIETPAPEETPTPKPTRTPYPEAYEKPIDAINAPAVVKSVDEVAVEGEVVKELTVLYQGRELTTYVKDGVVIKTAPDAVSYLEGMDVTYLKAGDVVHLTANLQGRVKSIEFIMRPDFTDYFENGISTAGIVGEDGQSEFVFGAAVGTYESGIEIADGAGEIYDLDVNPKAFVYEITEGRREADVEISGVGPKRVPVVRVPESNYVGNTISWAGMEEIPYVLARLSRGVVTDLIVIR